MSGHPLPVSYDPVQRYLAEIGRIRLLTRAQEVELATRVHAGQEAQRMLADPASRPGAEERIELEEAVVAGNEARRHFVEANLRWVVSVAKHYQGHGLALADLVQWGNLGLLEAVERFDERRGFRFTTYATWWIRLAITKGLADTGRTIRLPEELSRRAGRFWGVQQELRDLLGRDPSLAELAEALGLDVRQIAGLNHLPAVTRSLDEPLDGVEGSSFGDMVAHDEPSPYELVVGAELSRELERLLVLLDERERTILHLRYGLDGRPPRTLATVAQQLGIACERVRQLEQRGLEKLRHPANLQAWERARTYLMDAP